MLVDETPQRIAALVHATCVGTQEDSGTGYPLARG